MYKIVNCGLRKVMSLIRQRYPTMFCCILAYAVVEREHGKNMPLQVRNSFATNNLIYGEIYRQRR